MLVCQEPLVASPLAEWKGSRLRGHAAESREVSALAFWVLISPDAGLCAGYSCGPCCEATAYGVSLLVRSQVVSGGRGSSLPLL